MVHPTLEIMIDLDALPSRSFANIGWTFQVVSMSGLGLPLNRYHRASKGRIQLQPSRRKQKQISYAVLVQSVRLTQPNVLEK